MRNPWFRKKIWWLTSLEGKDHVLIFNKPVHMERARYLFMGEQRPDWTPRQKLDAMSLQTVY